MLSKIHQLRLDIQKNELTLLNLKTELTQIEKDCSPHDWDEPIYNPIRTEAYTIPAAPIGIMGASWRRAEMHVPATMKKRWSRTCRLCGHVEHTTNTNQNVMETPKFS